MRRYISVFLAVVVLFACMLSTIPTVSASKDDESRAIAIVFDNSGSMYDRGNQAWCRATYAMEVFASMLNDGDTLQIYPMNTITVNGKEYTMDSPLQINDAAQASAIREIYTAHAGITPIESIDCAVEGLKEISSGKKYLIVLTDGDIFYDETAKTTVNSYGELSPDETRIRLDERIQAQAGKTMTVMYLGIGSQACMPDTKESEFFVGEKVENSAKVLSTLTSMCNLIFGRDTLPKSRISGNTMELDVSVSKLIVFVQGENISHLKVTDKSGNRVSGADSQSTKYSTAGCGNYASTPDKTLQAMMVTCADCSAGDYTIEYDGTAASVEVYYEPDVELDFVFTDKSGNAVDPEALYEGEYKVSFGMRDAETGKLIESDLLGKTEYRGSCFINGVETPISCDKQSGEVAVSLKMDDTFEANLTVTYLSGYTITKDSSDFGWPSGGIKVSARPAGDFRLEISGGDDVYSLQDLEEGSHYTAKVFYEGEQLKGEALKNVDLKWDPDTSHVEIKQSFAEDHYDLSLHYKEPDKPENTVCGECTVTIHAFYTKQASREAQAQASLSYDITDDFSPLQVEMDVPEDYIVISELGESKAIVVRLTMNGEPLTPEDFAAAKLQVDCGGIEHEVTPNEQDSSYSIQLSKTEGIAEGDYPISATATYTDHIGRTTQASDSTEITLSKTPLWLKWLLGLLLLIALIIVIVLILHIRVLPKKIRLSDKTMFFDGDDVTENTDFRVKVSGGQMVVSSTYGGIKSGLAMKVKPGKDSYLRKPQARRSAEVKSSDVRKTGIATIQEASIGAAMYELNEKSGRLERVPENKKPFNLKNRNIISYSGTILDAGIQKNFSATVGLNFRNR